MKITLIIIPLLLLFLKSSIAIEQEKPKFGDFYDKVSNLLSKEDSSNISSILAELNEDYEVIDMRTRARSKYISLVDKLVSLSFENRLSNHQDYVQANMLLLRAYMADQELSKAEQIAVDLVAFFKEHQSVFKNDIHRFQFALIAIYRLQGLDDKAHASCEKLLETDLPAITKEAERLVYQRPKYKKRIGKSQKYGYVIVKFSIDKCGQVYDTSISDKSNGTSSFKKDSMRTIDTFYYVPALDNGKIISQQASSISFVYSPEAIVVGLIK